MKLVIFDCDGTLVDSQHNIVAAMRAAFTEHNLPVPDDATTRSVIGLSLPHAIQHLSQSDDITFVMQLVNSYKTAYRELQLNRQKSDYLFEGTEQVIQDLAAKNNVLLGIATGKSTRGVHALLAEYNLSDVFATIQTADTAPSKPHPAMIEQALEETGVNKTQALMIGDTSFDMQAARNAGVVGLGVAWGYHSSHDLLEAGALKVFDNFSELYEFIGDFFQFDTI